jgi:hypothetical protein
MVMKRIIPSVLSFVAQMRKPRSLGFVIWLSRSGGHPELGRDFFGTKEEYEAAVFWKDSFEPIEGCA